MRRPAIVAVLAGAALALTGCDDGEPSATTTADVVTVAPPTAVLASEPTTTTVAAPTTVGATTTAAPTTTVMPSAPGLDALLVPAGDIPLAVTAQPAARPVALCGTPLSTMPIDARAVLWVDAGGGTSVTSWVEIHPGEAMAAAAFAELTTTLGDCDWSGELPAQPRSSDLTARFVDTPELVASAPSCDRAVTGGVVRTTNDDAPVERREVLMVIVGCGDLVAAVRIDLLNQVPVDQQPWIGPLVNAEIARLAAAA